MPIDVSMYAQPRAQTEVPNLLGLYGQATQIQANQLLIQQRAREEAEKRALGVAMQGARTAAGKFDFGKAIEGVLLNPLTAANASQLVQQMAVQNKLSEDLVQETLKTTGMKYELLGRSAGGALEQAITLPDGSRGLEMGPVMRGLAMVANGNPALRPQVNAALDTLRSMDSRERYKMVEQIAMQGLTAKEGLDRVGSHLKYLTTPEGDIVSVDTKKPGLAKTVYEGKPKPVVAAPGSTIFDPKSGKPLYEVPDREARKPLVVGQGGSVYDPVRDRIVASTEPKDPIREQKLKSLIASGVNERVARGLVDDRLRIVVNPVSGEKEIVDTATGQPFDYSGMVTETPGPASANTRQVQQRFAPVEPAAAAGGDSRPKIDLYGDASKGTGIRPTIEALATEFIPQVLEVLPQKLANFAKGAPLVGEFFQAFPATVERRQLLDLAQNELIRSLAINAQFPVKEAERLRKEIGINPGLGSQEAMQARMRKVDQYLRERLESEQATIANGKLPAKQRQDASGHITAITRFIGKLNAPQPGAGGTGPAVAPAFSGMPSREERVQELKRRMQESTTDAP